MFKALVKLFLLKKNPKKLFTVSALGVLNYMYVVSGKKNPELNRYKI